jgi:putative transposase
MARGNNRMPIFLDDLDFARFLELFANVIARFEIDSLIGCVMPNHYHLVLRTRQPNLSLAIQHLNGGYAQWWNKRHAHVGHILQGRFKAQIVEASVYLVRLCRYVLLNPVRAGLCSHPQDWRWNSFNALAHKTPCDWVDVDSLLRCIDAANPDAIRARLIDYVNPEADPEMAAFIREDRRVIGTPAFAKQFRNQARAASREVPERERRVGTPALVEILAGAVEARDGLASGIRLAHESAGYSIADIVRCCGLSRKTVRRILERGRRQPGEPAPGAGPNVDLTPGMGQTQT